jgi:hypothetical protein
MILCRLAKLCRFTISTPINSGDTNVGSPMKLNKHLHKRTPLRVAYMHGRGKICV